MDIRRRSQIGGGDSGSGGNDVIPEPVNIDNYLTIEACEDGLTASLSVKACEYCINGDGNWKTLAAGTATESINSGHTLSFRGELTPNMSNGIGTFTISKKCNLKGNCMSMLFGDNAANNYSLSGKYYAFYKLFYNCTNIVNVSNNFLPATTLAIECYDSMFQGCSSLTNAPELPATTLANECYINMFNDCYNLIAAPELPATTLTRYCYSNMFGDCTSLTTAPELPATTLADYCYNSMFYNCTSLTTAPELPVTTLANACYSAMFYNCTNLTTAPELPATTLAQSCYSVMFYGCSRLKYIKMLATDISASWCLNDWVDGVASTGTFVKHADMTSLPTGKSGIPSGWTVVNDEEENNTPISLCDVAYWDGNAVKTCNYDNYSTSKGTAIGVVVIPEGFAPDGKARIIGLKPMDSFGMTNSYKISLYWDASGNCVDTSLTNYTKVPTTDNVSSNSTGSASISNSTTGNGCLPSDKFTGIQSYVDAISKYSVTSYLIPSPYSGDTYNPEYYKTISGNNALSDFNGLSNTQALVSLGSNYQAANYCWDYNDGSGSNIQWYLPAMGELGYLMPRLNAIDEIIVSLGGVAVQNAATLWSSSEYDSENVNYLELGSGRIRRRSKVTTTFARSFATIENNNGINTDDYLTIEALEDGLTASLSTNACEYCVDGDGNWKSLSAGSTTESINSGHTLSFRGNLTPTSSNGIGMFTIKKKCNLKGNCMSMLFGDESANNYSLSGKDYAFKGLFYSRSNIVSVSNNFLPATTLASYCYYNMFDGCDNLITAPELPATTLADSCYRNMFDGCDNLITAPELPATTLADCCYNSMFYNCTNLTTAPVLPATTLAYYCYCSMFRGCTSLTTAPELPATTLADSCYYNMFRGCTSLTTAPVLPATTLADSCYCSMFEGCTSLTTPPKLPATTLAYECYLVMFKGCTSLTTAPALPATTLASWCYSMMFQDCRSLTRAPVLPATTLKSYCYYYMFYGCTKLNYIKMLATNISENYCLYNWVSNVSNTGTFVKNPAMNSLPTGTSSNNYVGIPSGWTVLNA